MTKEKVLKLAIEAGFNPEFDDYVYEHADRFVHFAKLVTAHRYKEGYEAGLDAGRAEQQADMESLYAMYQQACKQRDMLMDQQRAQIAAIKGQIQ